MNLDIRQIVNTWVQAQQTACTHQQQLNSVFQAIDPDNQIFSLDTTNVHYTALVYAIVGPEAWEWVEWWCWECDFGQESKEFSINHQWYDTDNLSFLEFWNLICE